VKPTLLLLLFLAKLAQAHVDDGAELLAKAARTGDTQRLESLLATGINPDLPDRYGHTPLYYAAAYNEAASVELLLASHANPNTYVSTHYPADLHPFGAATPLQYAAERGNRRMASLLIEAGARVNEKGPTGRTALHCANRQLDVIALLLDKGADVNARDVDGTSPLDEAAWYGSLDTVALLLAHGARLNEPEPKTGATPMNEAAYKGQTKLVHYLLQFNPDLQIADKKGYRPLDNAIRMGKEDCALLLLAAEPKSIDTPEFLARALDAAVARDESRLVESLLEHGASVNALLPSGSTPLDAAAFSGAVNVVNVLLLHKADPNATGPKGNLPLEDAALKGYEPIVSALLDRGAHIDQISHTSGTTALYSAASFGKANTVRLLLNRGADPSLCGNNRKTPYQAALENGYTEAAAQIQSHGGTRTCGR
jgi:ankyrin repeat protein